MRPSSIARYELHAPGGGTSYTAIARHRNPDTRKTHEDMGFFDGWGTVATQLEAYAKELM